MGTLHTSDASQTITRVIDMFPAGQQDQVRSYLSQTLAAVLCQTLVPKLAGAGRVPAFEVMLANNPIRNLIREGRNHQLYGVLQVSKKEGMQTLNQSLADLVVHKAISESEACAHSTNVDELKTLCSYLKH